VTDANVQKGDDDADTSSTLLERIRANSPEGWERFVRLYSPIIYRWCRGWGLRGADADDVGQDVFRKVVQGIGSYARDGGKASFRRWLKTVAVNALRDSLRRLPPGTEGAGGSSANEKILDLAEAFVANSDDDSADDDERALLRGVVDEVLSRCKEQNRLAFIQVVMEEKDPAEVAQSLGTTTNAVYLAVSHLKSRIKKELDGLSESVKSS
jgi:RNA polymerase sigma-70 factor, ECF subfamily